MSEHLSFYLSLRRSADKAVAVAPSLLLLFRRPHSGVRLCGAVRQRRIAQVVFEDGGPLVVFCVVTLGENKGLLLRTCRGTKRSVSRFKPVFINAQFKNIYIYVYILCGRTQAVGLGSRIRGWSARAGASHVFVLLLTLSSHLISAVPVTVYPTV